MLQLQTNNDVELEFSDLPPIARQDALLWREPPARRIVLSSTLGSALGALSAAALFPADPALLFGAVLGAYGGFLAAAMMSGGGNDDIDAA